MPDNLPDYRQPMPDRGHEAIRQPLADAIDRLAEQVDRLNDAWLMLLSTADFAQATLNTVTSGQAAIAALQSAVAAVNARLAAITALDARVTALDARVTALETPPADTPPEV